MRRELESELELSCDAFRQQQMNERSSAAESAAGLIDLAGKINQARQRVSGGSAAARTV